MSCHRVRRELLWMSRFGEFGPDSEPHLDHLAACRTCRDEIGYDRETVRQLRVALAARVEGMEPSSGVWEHVRLQAQQPERRGFPWPWRGPIDTLAVRRTLTAMAGTGLALVLAINTEVVPTVIPRAESPTPEASFVEVADAPSAWGRQPRVAAGSAPAVETGATGGITLVLARPDPEGLVGNVDASSVLAPVPEPASDEPARQAPSTELTVTFRPPLGPEPMPAIERFTGTSDDDAGEPALPSPPPAGEPT